MTQRLRFRACMLDYANRVSLLVCHESSDGRISHIAKPAIFQMEEYSDDSPIIEGTFELNPDAAQNLLDSLIEAGMRPTKVSHPSGEIARLNDHLQDMRKLVFKTK
jgi:hypothetical protein